MIARFLTGLCRTDLYSLQIYITLIALAAFIIPTLIITVCYCFIIAVICRNDDDARRERTNWTFERQESLLSNGMSKKFSRSFKKQCYMCGFRKCKQRGGPGGIILFARGVGVRPIFWFFGNFTNKFKVPPPPHLKPHMGYVYMYRTRRYWSHVSITSLLLLTVTVDSSRGYPLGRNRNPIIERAKVRTVKMTFFIVLGTFCL